jgi:polyisoprenoid-binding protein YceI
VTGLPEKPQVGEEYAFKMTGTLTVAGNTKEVTFDVEATMNSETEIQGVATTSVNYKDLNLTIPKVPMVASVEDQVDLTFTFVAEKK